MVITAFRRVVVDRMACSFHDCVDWFASSNVFSFGNNAGDTSSTTHCIRVDHESAVEKLSGPRTTRTDGLVDNEVKTMNLMTMNTSPHFQSIIMSSPCQKVEYKPEPPADWNSNQSPPFSQARDVQPGRPSENRADLRTQSAWEADRQRSMRWKTGETAVVRFCRFESLCPSGALN
jgi:hypothetical protein